MTRRLQDIEIALADRPGALAEFGETLGRAGVSLEGGGVFTVGHRAVAHFLVDKGDLAARALGAAGLGPVTVHDVVMLKLKQGVPGQLGLLCRRMADADIDIAAQYSDHDSNLVLVVKAKDYARAQSVAAEWGGRAPPRPTTP